MNVELGNLSGFHKFATALQLTLRYAEAYACHSEHLTGVERLKVLRYDVECNVVFCGFGALENCL